MFIFIGPRRQKEPGATLLWPSSLRQERTQNLQSVSPSLNNTHSPLSLEKTAKPHSRRLYRWKFKLADVFRVHCDRERDVQCHDSEKTYFTPAGVNTSLAKTHPKNFSILCFPARRHAIILLKRLLLSESGRSSFHAVVLELKARED